MSVPEDSIENRIKQRGEALAKGSLETVPDATVQTNGNIPNTPLASAVIAFCLGSTFALGSVLYFTGGIPGSIVFTYQLGAFAAIWAVFHLLEFVVTAGWNREKCSVDCEWSCISPHLSYLTAV